MLRNIVKYVCYGWYYGFEENCFYYGWYKVINSGEFILFLCV